MILWLLWSTRDGSWLEKLHWAQAEGAVPQNAQQETWGLTWSTPQVLPNPTKQSKPQTILFAMDVAPQNIFLCKIVDSLVETEQSIDEMLRCTGNYVARAVPNAQHKVMQAHIFRPWFSFNPYYKLIFWQNAYHHICFRGQEGRMNGDFLRRLVTCHWYSLHPPEGSGFDKRLMIIVHLVVDDQLMIIVLLAVAQLLASRASFLVAVGSSGPKTSSNCLLHPLSEFPSSNFLFVASIVFFRLTIYLREDIIRKRLFSFDPCPN